LNATGYTLANYDSNNRAYSITAVSNGSDLTEAINSTSYTLSSAGVLTNATYLTWANITVNYTYIPTILLIGAVVLLFGVIVFLVAQYKKMNLGTGGSL